MKDYEFEPEVGTEMTVRELVDLSNNYQKRLKIAVKALEYYQHNMNMPCREVASEALSEIRK